MKKSNIITVLFLLIVCGIANAQNKEQSQKSPSTTIDATNLLDAQTDLYKNYMGDSLSSGKDPKSINGFLELVEESDFSTEEKKRLKEFYYNANLSPQKLDSLEIILKNKKPETTK